MESLPKHLTRDQRLQVWYLCRQGMHSMRTIAQERITNLVQNRQLGEIEGIDSTKPDKIDEVLRVQLKNGKRLFVKTTHDTPKAASWNDAIGLKPRDRIYVEKRALKWLTTLDLDGIEIPRVIYFDNQTRTLILNEVCRNRPTLLQALEQDRFSPASAKQFAAFLARCHHPSESPPPPFRETRKADDAHWRVLLTLHTTGMMSPQLPTSMEQQLKKLQAISLNASQPGFFHLDYKPENIFVTPDNIGIIDFERCCSVADPAFDLGYLLGNCWFWAIINCAEKNCLHSVQTLFEHYQAQTGNLSLSLIHRISAFAGTVILRQLRHERSHNLLPTMRKHLIKTAGMLMDKLD